MFTDFSFQSLEDDLVINGKESILENKNESDNECDSDLSFDAEHFAEWFIKDDDLSEKSVTTADVENVVECTKLINCSDDDSNFTLYVGDLAEWIHEDGHHEEDSIKYICEDEFHNSDSSYDMGMKVLVPDEKKLQLQANNAENSNRHEDEHHGEHAIEHICKGDFHNSDSSYDIKTLVPDEKQLQLQGNTTENTNDQSLTRNINPRLDENELFHRLKSSILRTETSRQNVLQCKIQISSNSTQENEDNFCKSFNLNSLKKRRLVFDLNESQKRLKNFGLQTSRNLRSSFSLQEGSQKRLTQLRNYTPNKSHSARAA